MTFGRGERAVFRCVRAQFMHRHGKGDHLFGTDGQRRTGQGDVAAALPERRQCTRHDRLDFRAHRV